MGAIFDFSHSKFVKLPQAFVRSLLKMRAKEREAHVVLWYSGKKV